MRYSVTLSVFLLCLVSFTFGQKTIQVVDKHGKDYPLSAFSYKGKEYFTDVNSKIHVSKDIDIQDTLVLTESFVIPRISYTSIAERNFIREVLRSSTKNNLKSLAPFQYQSYNKFFIHSTKIKVSEDLIAKILDKFNYQLKASEFNRHLVLSESISERKYFDELNESETVLWSKISGVDQALFLSLNSQMQTIDIFNTRLRILSTKYVNPLHEAASRGYHFSIADTMVQGKDKWVKVNFHPRKNSRFEAVKGFVWINLSDKMITSFYCTPVYGRGMKRSYALQFKKSDAIYFPELVTTRMILDNVSSSHYKIIASQSAYITDFRKDYSLTKNQFTDLALNYRTQPVDSVLRPIPLDSLEQRTYEYFSEEENDLRLQQSLKWGEQLYFGKINTQYVNIIVPDLIDYNRYENLRLGLGLSTTEKISKKHVFGAKIAYGFGDKAWKSGLNYEWEILEEDKLSFKAKVENDLLEAGVLNKQFTESFYSTESLRRFELYRFDQQIKTVLELESKPFNYLNANVKLELYRDVAHYQYKYLGAEGNEFREVSLALRYAYGERFFRFYDEQLTFKTPFPIFYLYLEKSLARSDMSYARAQLRVRYTQQFIFNGTTNAELILGNYVGQLPYFKLFNGLGSSSLKATIKSSFETMAYNEFTASQFAILFLSHDFGYFNFTEHKTFRPKVEANLNLGIGGMKSRELHQGIEMKSFNKGYGEFGVSVVDLLMAYPFGVKVSLGSSLYHRMLSYRYPTFKENSIFKVNLNVLI